MTGVPTCLFLDCARPAAVHVSGGRLEIAWSGDYCTGHALSCVDDQLWQVQRGMKITIRPIPDSDEHRNW